MVKHIQTIRRQIAKALVIHKNLTLQCLVSTKRPHILKQILTTHTHTYINKPAAFSGQQELKSKRLKD